MVDLSERPGIQAVFFDFMGTCLDWHSSVVSAFPTSLSEKERSCLALEWRQAFFDAIRSRPLGEAPEDIDTIHTRLLKEILSLPVNVGILQHFQSAGDDDQSKAVEQAVQAWHRMTAWPDVQAGLDRIRAECGCELFVLANGTTRLQLDLVRSSGLKFDMLFSSQLLGVSKPTPEIYRKALDLIKVEDPSRAVMVAAHAYDLRAAKDVGLKTIYIRRWTDDLDETDQKRLRRENDGNILDGFEGLAEIIKRL